MKVKAEQIAKLTGHKGPLYALEQYNEDFISGGSDRLAVKWEHDKKDGDVIARSSDAIFSLKFLKDRNQLLLGQAAGGIHVIDLATTAEQRLLQYHQSAVFDIVQTRHSFFSLGGDGILAVINNDLELVKQIRISDNKLRSAVILDDLLLTGDSNGRITGVNLSTLQPGYSFQAHTKGFAVNKIVVHNDIMLTVSRDAHINIYNVSDFSLLQSIPAHKGSIYDIAFHQSQQIFATASRDESVKIWDATSFSVLARLDEHMSGHSYSVNRLLWMDDILLSAGDDRTIIRWNISLL